MGRVPSRHAAAVRPRFRLAVRFSLRTFLAAVTIFCVVLGWRINRARLQRDAVAAIRAAGGLVRYDYQQHDPRYVWEEFDPVAAPWEPPWLLELVGIDFFHHVTAVSISSTRGNLLPWSFTFHLSRFPRLRFVWAAGVPFNDAGLRVVGRLQQLEFLFLTAPGITDGGVEQLRGLSHLKYIDLRSAHVGDRSLATLGTLPRLEYLEMWGNRLTDHGLAVLAGHRSLRHLRIGASAAGPKCSLSDVGVVHLAQLPQLEELGLQLTRVTPTGLAPLQRLPNLRILWLHRSPADDYYTVATILPQCDVRCSNGGGSQSWPVY